MNSTNKLFVLLFLGLLFQPAFPQNGIPFITHFESREGFESRNWAVTQDERNVMFFANRRGLLRYDGSEWLRIPMPHVPLEIKLNPYNNHLYVISESDYGYLQRDEQGLFTYIPLTIEGETTGPLTDVLFTDSTLLFYGENSISCHGVDDHVLIYRHFSDPYGTFGGLLPLENQLLVHVEEQGLLVVSKDTLTPARQITGKIPGPFLFVLSHGPSQLLAGTSDNRLVLFDGRTFRDYSISNPEYLSEYILSDGLEMNDTTYVFSTLYGGVLLVRKTDGRVIYTLNYDNGLPDDEIFSIGKDSNNGLWVTYGFGISRVDLRLPARDFSHYPGIEGYVTNTARFKGDLYVASTEGLFVLTEVKNFEEVEIYLKKKPEPVEVKPSEKKRSRKTEPTVEVEKKGFFNRLFGKKKGEVEVENAAVAEVQSKTTVVTKPQYEKKVVSKLKSIEHVYRKVQGLNSRCQQLLITDYGLMAGSSSGLYLVNNKSAERILNSSDINHLSARNGKGPFLISSDKGLTVMEFHNKKWIADPDKYTVGYPVFSSLESSTLGVWTSGTDVVSNFRIMGGDSVQSREYVFESDYPEETYLNIRKDTLFLFSESRVRYYQPEQDTFLMYLPYSDNPIASIEVFPPGPGSQWLKIDQRLVDFFDVGSGMEGEPDFQNLFENINSIQPDDKQGYWVIDDYSGIYHVDPAIEESQEDRLTLFIDQVTSESGELLQIPGLVLGPEEKMIRIHVSAPDYLKKNSTSFQYYIEDRMDDWSKWTASPSFEILIEPGEYDIQFRARNILGNVSEPAFLSFSVKTPFYKTSWFYLLLMPFAFLLMYLFFHFREQKLRKDKAILERKVEERTIEIQQQKQKIEMQKDEIMAQKDDITSSITYASRIQNAIFPAPNLFEKSFSDYFIFFRPRDIVSGDFYWISMVKEYVLFAVADCTGHGVPGAFMSMLGNSFLNEISRNLKGSFEAADILDQLRNKITDALAQSGDLVQSRDGMDISLCIYKKGSGLVDFSGAYNSLYLVRKGELTEYKADRMPIGYYPKPKQFTSYKIKVEKDDFLYLLSDGYQDQFGGQNNKKFTSARLKLLLEELAGRPVVAQHSILGLKLDEWQGNNSQIDDILLIGVRI